VVYDAATGTKLWAARTFPVNRTNSAAFAVAASPDGGTVYVAGEVKVGLTVVAYNAATGAPRWVSFHVVHQPGRGVPSVAVTPDGSTVFLNGPFASASGRQMSATVAYSAATGTRLWARAGIGQGGSRSLAVSPDGSKVFVTGATNPLGASTTGATLWAKHYQGPEASSVPFAVTVSPDGSRLFITGQSGGITPNAPEYFATVAYATGNGKQLWARTYPAGTTNSGYTSGGLAIGVSTDGTLVFVTGAAPGFRSNSRNFVTIAYGTASGSRSWIARYQGQRDFANATDLAVSPAGQAVFVTGFIGVHDGCCDFGTLAYQP
jgi:hypothetical protein